MDLKPEMARIARRPKRQTWRKLRAQSHGSEASKYGYDCQTVEKGETSES